MTVFRIYMGLAPMALLAACATTAPSIDEHHPAHPEAPGGEAYTVPEALDETGRWALPTGPESRPKEAEPPDTRDTGAIYTCPMHPEIRQDTPGACPICGMPLRRVEHEH
jgi:hypothetical protein